MQMPIDQTSPRFLLPIPIHRLNRLPSNHNPSGFVSIGTPIAFDVRNNPFLSGVCPMIQLNSGNVLLKPSHRKQLMSSLRRAAKMGERLGKFVLNLTLHRSGKAVEVTASVNDSFGKFDLRARSTDWRTAIRNLIRMLATRLHEQLILRTVAA
jgi:ribosome-associated translation inhibitor RaiA